MRWQDGRRSNNVEDRRGIRVGRVGGISGLGLLAVLVVSWLFGLDPTQLLQVLNGPAAAVPSGYEQRAPRATNPAEDRLKDFASVVLAETEDAWGAIFERAGSRYRPPRMVLFSGAVQSACGTADAAVGPFYCPGDAKLYLDLSFFDQLSRMGGPGEFARAYVIAHEVGHHVQNLVGTSDKVAAAGRRGRSGANSLSVKLELQADCYAGIWAHHADRVKGIVESGDVESALRAAAAIGDDTLQRRGQGYVVPDAFTHGTSAQRVEWFRRGYASGSVEACDTFR